MFVPLHRTEGNHCLPTLGGSGDARTTTSSPICTRSGNLHSSSSSESEGYFARSRKSTNGNYKMKPK
ncbi:hypothetical protein LSAT2_014267 [Lamellibrachia satsuma]|nr:hypothetical protein LSAT2_014267 [Lamellibrachia satsuma]